ncbi:hypothetical protein [Deinococcus sp. RIT780]|uniref:hypothetical protein n=1 Tax=Deinococcus sp. RIT780 TaxID=2870472 RepID=UPI001C8A6068|nr:hypothetical protein [Deinococcus sp. RIT780]MBX8465002.1 hypothetical protein [Deinococcus sp. RIT780]
MTETPGPLKTYHQRRQVRRRWAKTLRIFLIFLGFLACVSLVLLWLSWPHLVAGLSAGTGISADAMAVLGQFGDLYGGLTSIFTLTTLIFSISVNYLQYRQFGQLRRSEVLNNHRSINAQLMDDTVMDAAKMIRYKKFGYKGTPGGNKNTVQEEKFNDLRIDNNQRDKYSDQTGRKVDKILMVYEQILILVENDMLDKQLSLPYEREIEICIMDRDIKTYLFELADFFQGDDKTPYMRLTLMAKEHEKDIGDLAAAFRRAQERES